jgi:hypothetical protein
LNKSIDGPEQMLRSRRTRVDETGTDGKRVDGVGVDDT